VLAVKVRNERQQGDVPRALDGCRQRALMLGAGSGLAAGTDLAAIADVPLQQCHIFVIDVINLLSTELANFPASGVTAAPWSVITHCLVLLVLCVLSFNQRPMYRTRRALPIRQDLRDC
jgi:hypothetical protein